MTSIPLPFDGSRRMTAAEIFLKYDAEDSGVIQIEELNCMLEDAGHEITLHNSQELRSESLNPMDEEISFTAFAAMVRVFIRPVPPTGNIPSDESSVVSLAQLRTLDARAHARTTKEAIDANKLLTAVRACGHVKTTAEDADSLLMRHCASDSRGLTRTQFERALEDLDAVDYSHKKRDASLKRVLVKLGRCADGNGAEAVLTTEDCSALLRFMAERTPSCSELTSPQRSRSTVGDPASPTSVCDEAALADVAHAAALAQYNSAAALAVARAISADTETAGEFTDDEDDDDKSDDDDEGGDGDTPPFADNAAVAARAQHAAQGVRAATYRIDEGEEEDEEGE